MSLRIELMRIDAGTRLGARMLFFEPILIASAMLLFPTILFSPPLPGWLAPVFLVGSALLRVGAGWWLHSAPSLRERRRSVLIADVVYAAGVLLWVDAVVAPLPLPLPKRTLLLYTYWIWIVVGGSAGPALLAPTVARIARIAGEETVAKNLQLTQWLLAVGTGLAFLGLWWALLLVLIACLFARRQLVKVLTRGRR